MASQAKGMGAAWAWHAMCESALTLHTALVSTVRSLFVSYRHGQTSFYLFQKHLLYWE